MCDGADDKNGDVDNGNNDDDDNHGDDDDDSCGTDSNDQEGDDDGDNDGDVDVGASCMGGIRSATQRIGIRWVLVNDGPMNRDPMCVVPMGWGPVDRDPPEMGPDVFRPYASGPFGVRPYVRAVFMHFRGRGHQTQFVRTGASDRGPDMTKMVMFDPEI